MKKLLTALTVAAVLPTATMAAGENNIGSCGWGSKLFDGQSGLAPQVLGATTNGTSGNQTFAITSGTSGCTQDGAVKSSWKTAMFIDGNKEKLARDMSRGSGEALDSLAHLLGVEAQDRAAFGQITKDNLARIFPNESVSTDQVVVALREVLATDTRLGRYIEAL
jgi:hypothetical protein